MSAPRPGERREALSDLPVRAGLVIPEGSVVTVTDPAGGGAVWVNGDNGLRSVAFPEELGEAEPPRWTCPRCLGETTSTPATSRKDDKTNICDSCGVAEAVLAALGQDVWITYPNPERGD